MQLLGRMSKQRLDTLLAERGLFSSRTRAAASVMAGEVRVGTGGRRAAKPGELVDPDELISVDEGPAYVSRGGVKLANALDESGLRVAGRLAIDVGSSTGGFTDCLLQRGAARVYDIDAGTGQLDWKLRNDPRVVVHEQVNARYLSREQVPEPIDLAVCDVSFISITMILPAIVGLLAPHAEMVILVKPQFELERREVGKGGIVRDPALHLKACRRVEQAVQALNFHAQIIPSPVLGAEGNKEFLLHARH